MIGNQTCPSYRELYNPSSNLRYSQAAKGSDIGPEPLERWHRALRKLLTIDRLHDPYPKKLLDCVMQIFQSPPYVKRLGSAMTTSTWGTLDRCSPHLHTDGNVASCKSFFAVQAAECLLFVMQS